MTQNMTRQEADLDLQRLLLERQRERTGVAELGAVDFPLLNRDTCRLFRVSCLTYEKDFPRQEAFENVVASINDVPCRLVYYLRGVEGGVEFYIGVVNTSGDSPYNMGDYGNMLSRAFKGNFLGSELREVGREEGEELLNGLCSKEARFSALLGVPTRNSEREDIAFQGVDRLVNIMTSGGHSLGQRFHLLVIWEAVKRQDLLGFEQLAKDIYSLLREASTANKRGRVPRPRIPRGKAKAKPREPAAGAARARGKATNTLLPAKAAPQAAAPPRPAAPANPAR